MKRILVVDDDADILRLSRHLLTEIGVHVETCDTVLLALEKVRTEEPYDLILCDVKMPRLSGYDLILTLKKDPRHKKIPVAMLSGKKEKTDILQAIEMGAHDYIIKPFEPQSFIHRVTEMLARGEGAETFTLPKNFRLPRPERATATLALEILSLNEKHITLKSPQFLDSGLLLWVGCPFLRQIGLHSPQMKVVSSRLAGGGADEESWLVQATFHKLNPRDQKALTAWLNSQQEAA